MKKRLIMLSLLTVFILNLFGETDDLMNIKIDNNIILKNGYGTISGKPILNDKELEQKIILRGQFNVDKQKNAEFKFDQVEHDGKIYNLNNAFIKKGRLKSADITLKKDSNLTVSGGNKEEILNIINATVKRKDNSDKQDNEVNSSTNFSSPASSYGSNGNGFSPSYLDKNSNSDTNANNDSSTNANKEPTNLATVVQCPKNEYKDGEATYYIQLGTICTPKTTRGVEKKYNTASCPNKIDYDKKIVSVGYEIFVNDPQYSTYLVQQCQYTDPIALNSEIGSCKPNIDYTNSKAFIKERYFYTFNNEKSYVGECLSTNQAVNLQYDLNSCSEDRHDFTNNVSIAQGQYYYNYNHKRTNVGECVDIKEFTFPHYKDSSSCKPRTIGDKIFYEERIAYNDLTGQKFATDCQVINNNGEEIFSEFAGYTFNDSSQQAIRKESQYFINPKTNGKEYINRDKETSITYDYETKQCGIENDLDKHTTTFYNEVYFNDTNENKKVYVKECSADTVVPTETQYNTDTCLNKIDYDNSQIELGYELFAKAPSYTKQKVQECQYTDPIPLDSEVGNCKPNIDYEQNKAFINKKYFYTFKNEKSYVGECELSKEEMPLQYDLNDCEEDKHDFENGVSIAQGQYYYNYNHQKNNVGECVDINDYTYTHYMDDTTCKYTVVDGRVLYKKRVAYNDLLGVKKFANDCQVTNAGGLNLIEEFAGYQYNDTSKQAIRKINQYFIIPDTTTKEYVSTNTVTSKAYPYRTVQCKVENDDEARQTVYYQRTYFQDTDEEKEVEISPCEESSRIPYTALAVKDKLISTLTNQWIVPINTTQYALYSDKSKILSNVPNWSRRTNVNITGVKLYKNTGIFRPSSSQTFTYGDISFTVGVIRASSTLYTVPSKYPFGTSQLYNFSYGTLTSSDLMSWYTPYSVTMKNGVANNQIIEVIEQQQEYVRGDGTKYILEGSGERIYKAK